MQCLSPVAADVTENSVLEGEYYSISCLWHLLWIPSLLTGIWVASVFWPLWITLPWNLSVPERRALYVCTVRSWGNVCSFTHCLIFYGHGFLFYVCVNIHSLHNQKKQSECILFRGPGSEGEKRQWPQEWNRGQIWETWDSETTGLALGVRGGDEAWSREGRPLAGLGQHWRALCIFAPQWVFPGGRKKPLKGNNLIIFAYGKITQVPSNPFYKLKLDSTQCLHGLLRREPLLIPFGDETLLLKDAYRLF